MIDFVEELARPDDLQALQAAHALQVAPTAEGTRDWARQMADGLRASLDSDDAEGEGAAVVRRAARGIVRAHLPGAVSVDVAEGAMSREGAARADSVLRVRIEESRHTQAAHLPSGEVSINRRYAESAGRGLVEIAEDGWSIGRGDFVRTLIHEEIHGMSAGPWDSFRDTSYGTPLEEALTEMSARMVMSRVEATVSDRGDWATVPGGYTSGGGGSYYGFVNTFHAILAEASGESPDTVVGMIEAGLERYLARPSRASSGETWLEWVADDMLADRPPAQRQRLIALIQERMTNDIDHDAF